MKQLITTVIILLSFFPLIAQDRMERVGEKIEARRVAYLTHELDLSVEEAQQFWPIYNEFRAAQEQLSGKYKNKEGDKTKSADEKLENLLLYDEEVSALRSTYTQKFKQIIGPEKTIKLIRAQRKFKEKLLKKIKERRKHKRGGK